MLSRAGLLKLPDLKDPSVVEALRSLRLFFGRDLLGWSLQGVAESSKNLQGSDEVEFIEVCI